MVLNRIEAKMYFNAYQESRKILDELEKKSDKEVIDYYEKYFINEKANHKFVK